MSGCGERKDPQDGKDGKENGIRIYNTIGKSGQRTEPERRNPAEPWFSAEREGRPCSECPLRLRAALSGAAVAGIRRPPN